MNIKSGSMQHLPSIYLLQYRWPKLKLYSAVGMSHLTPG